MATLTAKAVSLTGTDASLVAAAGGGDATQPGDKTFIHVKNGGTGSITVTVNSVAPSSYGGDEDVVVTVGAGAEKYIGPLIPGRFIDTDGLVHWTYSGVTSCTVNAFFI